VIILVLATIQVLSCGFKLSIGSDENTPLWNQPWLHDAGRIFPVSQQQLAWPNITLSELLASHAKQ